MELSEQLDPAMLLGTPVAEPRQHACCYCTHDGDSCHRPMNYLLGVSALLLMVSLVLLSVGYTTAGFVLMGVILCVIWMVRAWFDQRCGEDLC